MHDETAAGTLQGSSAKRFGLLSADWKTLASGTTYTDNRTLFRYDMTNSALGRAFTMTGLKPPWNAPRQNGWDSGPCRGSREVGRRYVSRHPCHGNGAGYANHNPRVTNHNPRGTVTANRPPLSRRFQFLINFQRQWSHNQS